MECWRALRSPPLLPGFMAVHYGAAAPKILCKITNQKCFSVAPPELCPSKGFKEKKDKANVYRDVHKYLTRTQRAHRIAVHFFLENRFSLLSVNVNSSTGFT